MEKRVQTDKPEFDPSIIGPLPRYAGGRERAVNACRLGGHARGQDRNPEDVQIRALEADYRISVNLRALRDTLEPKVKAIAF